MMPPPHPAMPQGSGAASKAPAPQMTDDDYAARLMALGTSEEEIKRLIEKSYDDDDD
jgi:hypothetical protein